MSQYDTEVDLDNVNNSQSQAVQMVGRDKRVLDVGCWKGDLGRALISRGCQVSGLDIDEAAAEIARETHDEVVFANLDSERLKDCFAEASFDVIVFADVLEHVLDPGRVLADAAFLLRPDGFVVMSIPNITHGSVRLALLQGLWDYSDTGHLDRTHLRFFSRRGLVETVRGSGFVIDELGATVVDVLSREVMYDPDLLPGGIVEWVRDQPDAMVFQFMVKAHPSTAAARAPVPALVPAIPLHSVRPVDRFTERAEEDLARTQRLLSQRDHVLGLEASAASATSRADVAERVERSLRRRLAAKNETITNLRRKVGGLERRAAERAPSTPPALSSRVRDRWSRRRGTSGGDR